MSRYQELTVGDRFETRGRTITEADLLNFAGVSGDFNHLHTDAEAMTDSAYGERIVHGALVFAMMTGLIWQNRDEAARSDVVAFYGVDHLRFVAPVFIDDTIHVELTVAAKEPRDHPTASGTVHYDTAVINQHDETILACEIISLLR